MFRVESFLKIYCFNHDLCKNIKMINQSCNICIRPLYFFLLLNFIYILFYSYFQNFFFCIFFVLDIFNLLGWGKTLLYNTCLLCNRIYSLLSSFQDCRKIYTLLSSFQDCNRMYSLLCSFQDCNRIYSIINVCSSKIVIEFMYMPINIFNVKKRFCYEIFIFIQNMQYKLFISCAFVSFYCIIIQRFLTVTEKV